MSAPTVDLWLPFGTISKLALSIPLAECGNYVVNPLKWPRFIGYAICGREGYFSTSQGGTEIGDYTADIEARQYYFISKGKSDCDTTKALPSLLTLLGEPRLVDVDAMDDRTTDASDLTERRTDFRRRVIARDNSCLLTADPVFVCDACHILPHSKGDNVRSSLLSNVLTFRPKYISNVLYHRSRTNNSVDDFDDGINDPRNGLLLTATLHRLLGAPKSAFLKVSCLFRF